MKSQEHILREYFNNQLTWAELYSLNRDLRDAIAGRELEKVEHEEIDHALGYYEILDIEESKR